MQRKTGNSRILSSVLLFLIALFPLLACLPSHPVSDHGTLTQKPKPRIRVAELEKRIHSLINQERRKHGLTPLAWDNALSSIARDHSRDMARKNYFSHDSPEGHDFPYRYARAGYRCAVRVERTIHMGAENIALNNLYDRVTTVNGKKYYDWNSEGKIAETTVEGWMNSPGHRKNILTTHWRNEGIGVHISPDDRVYITQNFC